MRSHAVCTKWAKDWISEQKDVIQQAAIRASATGQPLHEVAFELWNLKFAGDEGWLPDEAHGKALVEEIETMREPAEGGKAPPKTIVLNNQAYVLLPLKKRAADEHVFQDQEGYKSSKDGDQFPFNAVDTGDKLPDEGNVGETEHTEFKNQANQGRQHMKDDAKGAPGAPPSAEDRIESPEYVIASAVQLRSRHAVVKERVKEAMGGIEEFLGAPAGEFIGMPPPGKGLSGPPEGKGPLPDKELMPDKAEKPREKPEKKDKPEKGEKKKAPPEITEAVKDLVDVQENLEEAEEILDAMSSLATAACDERKSTRWSLARKKKAMGDVEQVKEILDDAEDAAESAEKALLKAYPDAKPKGEKKEDGEKTEKAEGEGKETDEKKEVKEEMKKEDRGAMKPEEILGSLNFMKTVSEGINRLAVSEPFPGDEAEFTGDKQVPTGDPGQKEVSDWNEQAGVHKTYRGKEQGRPAGSPMSAENRWEEMKDVEVGKYSVRFVDHRIPAKTSYQITAFTREGEKMGTMKASFGNVAKGNMTKDNFDLFTSDEYKYALGDHLKVRGLNSVAAEMHGTWESETGVKGSEGNVLEGVRKFDPYRARKQAKGPNHKPDCDCNFYGKGKGKKKDEKDEKKKDDKKKDEKKSRFAKETVKDRALQQSYYNDMFGDPEFARLMVSRIKGLKKTNAELKEQLASVDEDKVLEARAKRGYDLAVEEIELGIIDNTRDNLLNRTEEIATMDEDGFEEARANIDAWKRQGQIGDTLVDYEEEESPPVESGIKMDTLRSVDELGETEEVIVDPTEQVIREPEEVNLHRDLGGEGYVSGGFNQVRGNVEGLEESRNQVSERTKAQIRNQVKSGAVVPQLTKTAADLSATGDPLANLHKRFSTTKNKIEKGGIQFGNPTTRHNN